MNIKTQILTENANRRETNPETPVITEVMIDEKQAEILERMALAFRQDRAKLFQTIDGMRNQPKFADKLTEIEAVAQTWRDLPDTADFPNITHPNPLPEWFPKVKFFSRWEKDIYIEKTLLRWARTVV